VQQCWPWIDEEEEDKVEEKIKKMKMSESMTGRPITD
jgi:hypothetical protein